MVMVRQFCCGCSLGTGSLIIGIIETIGGIINVILCIVAAVEAGPDPRMKEGILDALDTIRVSNIVLAVVTTILTLLSALLIVGVKQNRPSLLVPWMTYTCFAIFANVVSYVISTVAYFETGEVALAVISIIGALANISIHTYFLVIVYSLYRELRGEDLLDL